MSRDPPTSEARAALGPMDRPAQEYRQRTATTTRRTCVCKRISEGRGVMKGVKVGKVMLYEPISGLGPSMDLELGSKGVLPTT
jgi:hypothetical protein